LNLLSLYLSAFWNAPAGRRFDFVRKLRRAAAASLPTAGECFDIGEFRSFEQFEIKYRALAPVLGKEGKEPPPGELNFLHAMVDRDHIRHPGGVGSRDYFFLTAMVSLLAPRRVVEIGTLSGFSAAIIAAAIDRQHGNDAGLRSNRKEITVETIDTRTHCINDATRPTGFEIPELIPDLVSSIRVHTGHESDFARNLAEPGGFGLAFIDADHRHPWPLLDVLRLAPYLESGGWIVLHDIQLGTHGEKAKQEGLALEEGTPFGAEWLFERWPFRKIRSFHIGAIQLPSRLDALVPFAISLMEEPFEVTGKAAKGVQRALIQSLGALG